MATIDYIHLPKEVTDKLCMCTGKSQQDGWGLDQETGFWVHRVHDKKKPQCDKPSIANGIVQCEECEKPFVPEKYKTVKFARLGLGAVCPPCEELL